MKLKEKTELFYTKEPSLTFAYSQKMSDPRDGITLFGPFTKDKIQGPISVGVIGPKTQRGYLRKYLELLHKPVWSSEKDIARPYFPGLEAAYGIYINFDNFVEIDVPKSDIDKYLKYTNGHQRVHNLTNLFVDGIINYNNSEEIPVLVWFVAIPEEIYTFGRPNSHIPASEDNVRYSLSKKDRYSTQEFLFDDMKQLKEAYQFEIDFHNQLKAKLLNHRVVTQIIRESKIAYDHIWNSDKKIDYERKFDADKAWNIATALYYKSGGLPWRLGDVRDGVCYLGLVYKKSETDMMNKNACCAAQMFLDSGDGMVFRGNIGPWYNPITKEFHLSKEDAFDLLSKSLEAFKLKSPNNKYPEEVFIHARTYFDDDEWEGFQEAATDKSQIVGIRIRNDSGFKLYRDFTYCVPRGATLTISERNAFLWTKGFIPRLQTQMGAETPNPLSVEITRGISDLKIVCRDILALTKLNYNSCKFADGLPVTLRFADSIGEVLTAGKSIKSEVLSFKHYI
ncbi:MAG: hypothetical protein CV087_05675 [Candidatus Brocadia sp. WS118]|nr:MAG: hypothetical protein CV087_05675 [Candidatus Brocadia sp. WS118]